MTTTDDSQPPHSNRMHGDGKLSFEELNARRDPAKMFAKLDTNEDGSLSAEEFEKARKHHGKGHGKDHKRKAD